MSFTNATVSSITGAPHTSIGTTLAFSAALSRELNPDIVNDATTDPFEAYRRLGVEPDQLIQRFAMCTEKSCCHLVPMSGLNAYQPDEGHPDTSGSTCRSALFTLRGRQRRPFKVLAFTPPSVVLRSFLREPSFVTELQAWRNDYQEDQISEVPPTSGEPFCERLVPMRSVFDGSAWRKRMACKRRTIEGGIVRDVPHGKAQRLVAMEFGLLAAINLDW